MSHLPILFSIIKLFYCLIDIKKYQRIHNYRSIQLFQDLKILFLIHLNKRNKTDNGSVYNTF